MRAIPKTADAIVLRTDFSDEKAWRELADAIQAPVGEFRAYVTLVSDPSFERATLEEVSQLASAAGHTFMFIADSVAVSEPDHPILVLDLAEEPGRTFRVIPSEAWGVENNLSIANMGFDEFADAVDPDGVFRGFPRP